MKKIILALALAGCVVAPAFAGPDVSVSIGIHQPGVYGRIDIGRYPQPVLVYPQPIVVAPPTVVVPRQPIYLYVPPQHQHDWRHYCGRYNACGQPVYFVQESWVRDRYQREHPGWRDNGRHRGWDKHDRYRGDDGRRGGGHGKHGKRDKHDH